MIETSEPQRSLPPLVAVIEISTEGDVSIAIAKDGDVPISDLVKGILRGLGARVTIDM